MATGAAIRKMFPGVCTYNNIREAEPSEKEKPLLFPSWRTRERGGGVLTYLSWPGWAVLGPADWRPWRVLGLHPVWPDPSQAHPLLALCTGLEPRSGSYWNRTTFYISRQGSCAAQRSVQRSGQRSESDAIKSKLKASKVPYFLAFHCDSIV